MQRRWPLHPKPRDWEGLETGVRRIAAACGVSYDTFLRHALERTGSGARNLDQASEATLERLAEGPGVPLERLRGMRSGAIMARRVASVAAWMETEAGQTARDQLREVVRRMSHRPTDIPDHRSRNLRSTGAAEHRLSDRFCDILHYQWGNFPDCHVTVRLGSVRPPC